MLRRNIDFLAIAAAMLAMALVQHIPPPRAVAAAKAIHFQNAVVQDRCPLVERILSVFEAPR